MGNTCSSVGSTKQLRDEAASSTSQGVLAAPPPESYGEAFSINVICVGEDGAKAIKKVTIRHKEKISKAKERLYEMSLNEGVAVIPPPSATELSFGGNTSYY